MEDVNYLTEADIQLDDIASCLGDVYQRYFVRVGNSRELLVHFTERQYCRWWERLSMDEVFNELEDWERLELLKLQPTSIFLVNYHPSNIPELVQMLKRVLACYGGYVGGVGAYHSLDKIDKLELP